MSGITHSSSSQRRHPHADAIEVQPGRISFAVDADHSRHACREAPATYSPGEVAPPTAWPVFPDAGVVHATLRSLQAIGNDARLRFIDALRVLYECNLYYELGYAIYEQYCARELGIARSTAFEYLQVARALDELPRLRILYGEGELSWAQVRAMGPAPHSYAPHDYRSGGTQPPVASSTIRAAASATSSRHGRPTSCTPHGSPSGVAPARTTTAG